MMSFVEKETNSKLTFFTAFAVSETEPKYFFKANNERPMHNPHPRPVKKDKFKSILRLDEMVDYVW